jgi:predicted AAA+ superfamily ATPase
MLQLSTIKEAIASQRHKTARRPVGLEREMLPSLPDLDSHALIISGIRRCGKSTLLLQLLNRHNRPSLYVNFEDPRLFGFELPDFRLLDSIIAESQSEALFFDEIQVVNGWELYVRQKLDERFRVTVAGSNASLLSRELGTKLTGRHITKELFPFSYREFLAFKSLPAGEKSWKKYAETGGFPEFVKTNNADILTALLYDVITRDIVVRHGIRDANALKRLAVYLTSNVGAPVTAGKLLQPLGVKSPATVLEYFSFLEDAYLVNFLPKFSYSAKAQLINPRKVYVIDPGIISVTSTSSTRNEGRKLENLVYCALRRKGYELYYFNESGHECDFVVMNKGQVVQAIQVCHELTPETATREQRGLREAMQFFGTANGLIVTTNQTDAYMDNDTLVNVIPAHRFISDNLALT